MSRIKIRNFGPIKEGNIENDGWVDIEKVSLFIGNQGSGKSVVAKLISTFTWIEKAIVRGDFDEKWFSRKNKLKNTFLPYHRLENYFPKGVGLNRESEIEYHGEAYFISYKDSYLQLTQKSQDSYDLPQIMYVPAERNFISYVRSPKELKLSSPSLQEFLAEYDRAKKEIKKTVSLPINKATLEYDKLNDIINIKGEDYKVRLSESSSGFQSLTPLFLVSDFLSQSVKLQSEKNEPMSDDETNRFKAEIKIIMTNTNLTDEQKRIAISTLSARFNKTAFINIVEEPEQNLFPTSQWELLKSLFKFNNRSLGNKLILTSHSPYILNYMSIAIQAGFLNKKIPLNHNLKDKLNKIIPLHSILKAKEVAIYQFDETEGTISRLKDYEGIPTDDNRLNMILRKGNQLFDALLEIEEEL